MGRYLKEVRLCAGHRPVLGEEQASRGDRKGKGLGRPEECPGQAERASWKAPKTLALTLSEMQVIGGLRVEGQCDDLVGRATAAGGLGTDCGWGRAEQVQ